MNRCERVNVYEPTRSLLTSVVLCIVFNWHEVYYLTEILGSWRIISFESCVTVLIITWKKKNKYSRVIWYRELKPDRRKVYLHISIDTLCQQWKPTISNINGRINEFNYFFCLSSVDIPFHRTVTSILLWKLKNDNGYCFGGVHFSLLLVLLE